MGDKTLSRVLKTIEGYMNDYPVNKTHYRVVAGQLGQICDVLEVVMQIVDNDEEITPLSEVSPVLLNYDDMDVDEPNATPIVITPEVVDLES